MADENTTGTPVSTPAAAPSPAPVETPAAAPAPSATPESVAPAAPVVAPESTPSPEPAPVEAAKTNTLLGGEAKKEAAPVTEPAKKPVEGEKTTEVKPEADKKEGSQSAEPAPLPSYEPWTVPEGVTIEPEKAGKFAEILGQFQTTTKAEQAAVQKFGQELVDYHIAQVKEVVERQAKHQNDAWVKMTNDWKEAFVKDPEIGGNRQETTVSAAIAARDLGASVSKDPAVAEAQKAEIVGLMQTGVGNHPALLRTFANLHNIIEGYKNKYEREGAKPLAGQVPEPSKKSKTQTMYGKSA